MVGMGPPGRPAYPRPVCAYTITTLAAVILGKMSHMPTSSADLASEQDELPRPKTIVFIAALSYPVPPRQALTLLQVRAAVRPSQVMTNPGMPARGGTEARPCRGSSSP